MAQSFDQMGVNFQRIVYLSRPFMKRILMPTSRIILVTMILVCVLLTPLTIAVSKDVYESCLLQMNQLPMYNCLLFNNR